MARQVELLEGSIPGTLTRLAAPIMGSQLIQMAYNLVDMLWIGWIGAGAVAAVGAAGMYVWLANGLVVLARMGGQVLVARIWARATVPWPDAARRRPSVWAARWRF